MHARGQQGTAELRLSRLECQTGSTAVGREPLMRECSHKSLTFWTSRLLRSYHRPCFKNHVFEEGQHTRRCVHLHEVRSFSTRIESHQAASTSGSGRASTVALASHSSATSRSLAATTRRPSESSQAGNGGNSAAATVANGTTPIGDTPRKGSKAARNEFRKTVILQPQKAAGRPKGSQKVAKKTVERRTSTTTAAKAAPAPKPAAEPGFSTKEVSGRSGNLGVSRASSSGERSGGKLPQSGQQSGTTTAAKAAPAPKTAAEAGSSTKEVSGRSGNLGVSRACSSGERSDGKVPHSGQQSGTQSPVQDSPAAVGNSSNDASVNHTAGLNKGGQNSTRGLMDLDETEWAKALDQAKTNLHRERADAARAFSVVSDHSNRPFGAEGAGTRASAASSDMKRRKLGRELSNAPQWMENRRKGQRRFQQEAVQASTPLHRVAAGGRVDISRTTGSRREMDSLAPIDVYAAALELAAVNDDETDLDVDDEETDTDTEDSQESGGSRQTPARLNELHSPSRDEQPVRSKRLVQLFNDYDVPVPTKEEEQIGGPQEGFYRDLLEREGLLLPINVDNARFNGFVLNRLLSRVHTWRAVFWIVRDLRHHLDAINVATAMHRLARYFSRDKVPLKVLKGYKEYDTLIAFLRKRATMMSHRQLANCVWALGTLREDQADGIFQLFMDTISEQGFRGRWIDQEISNVVWAMGTLGVNDRKVLKAVKVVVLESELEAFSPQSMANLAWACATLNYKDMQVYEALAKGCYRRLADFGTQSIANVFWAFGQINFYHEGLFRAVAVETAARAGEFNCQELSNILLTFARLNVLDDIMMETLEVELVKEHRVKGMAQQGLSNVLWSFATLRYYSQGVLDTYMDELVVRIEQLHGFELANSLWSCARLGYHPGDRLQLFGQRIETILPILEMQACSNMLWALSILQGPQHLPCFQKLIDRFGSMDVKQVQMVQLHQLFQALLIARKEAEAIGGPQVIIPPEVEASVTGLWKVLVKRVSISNFQEEVSRHLTRMGVSHISEYKAEEGLFSIDIAFSGPNGMRVAMEVDGPYHFTVNTHMPLGAARLRHRLLTAFGWTVVSVKYFEYFCLKDKRAKIAYLAKKLIDIGIPLPRELLDESETPAATARKDWTVNPRANSRDIRALQDKSRELGGVRANPLSKPVRSTQWTRQRVLSMPPKAHNEKEAPKEP